MKGWASAAGGPMAAESGSSATKTPSHRWVLPRALLPPKTGWQPEPEPLPVPSPRAGWAAAAADMAPAPFGCQPGQRGPRAHRCLRKPVASAGGGPRRCPGPPAPAAAAGASLGAPGCCGGSGCRRRRAQPQTVAVTKPLPPIPAPVVAARPRAPFLPLGHASQPSAQRSQPRSFLPETS